MAVAAVAPRATIRNKKIIVRLYAPHSDQLRLHRSHARFRVCPCGRRFGKTLACANEISKFALEHAYTNSVWIAPVYRQCKVVYRLLKRALREAIVYTSDTELRIELLKGSVIEFYSATNPDSIRGNKFHFVVMDECADIHEDVWFKVIRPTLSDTNGRVIFIGTPKGRNWFFRLFIKGNDPLETDYESFTFPTSANPFIPRKEIEAAQQDLPEAVYEQEYLAVFHEESAGVFRGIDKCFEGDIQEVIEKSLYISVPPRPGFTYVMGWDVAKYNDFSVMNILNADTMHIDAWFRTNMVDYTEQIKRARTLTELYNDAFVLMDSTGVGDPVLEMVRAAGMTADGYLYTNASKKMLIEELQITIEHRGMTFPNIPIQTGELRTMQYKLSPSRFITYEAPKGFHDDCCNSLALAKHAAGREGRIPFQARSLDPTTDNQLDIQDYDNDELLERQMNVSRMLGNVDLVVGGGW